MTIKTLVRGISKRLGFLLSLSFLLFCTSCATSRRAAGTSSAVVGAQPRELGAIAWNRSFDDALEHARKRNKPLLVLFQEVPGCGTCTDYGDKVLSHPLIVDAVETLFVPVAIYNNIEGDDERVLKMFDEPAWNNPVVRIMTADKRPLAPRVADEYTVGQLAEAILAARVAQNREIPAYLSTLAEEQAAPNNHLETATLAMHCFWEGESALGDVPGILSTRAGFVGKDEVVEVTFDRDRIDYASIIKKAQSLDCASRVYTRDDGQQREASQIVSSNAVRSDERIRPDKDPKYYLSQTPYRYVPMVELQAMRINHAIHEKGDVDGLLSPSQLRLLELVQRFPDAGWESAIGSTDIVAAWKKAEVVSRTFAEQESRRRRHARMMSGD